MLIASTTHGAMEKLGQLVYILRKEEVPGGILTMQGCHGEFEFCSCHKQTNPGRKASEITFSVEGNILPSELMSKSRFQKFVGKKYT